MPGPDFTPVTPRLLDYLWRGLRLPRKAIRLLLFLHGVKNLEQRLEAFPERVLQDLPPAWRSELPPSHPKFSQFQPAPNLLSRDHPPFPPAFKELHDPPFVLYYRGGLDILSHPGPRVAVVGTRRASDYGRRMAAQWIAHSAPYGPLIISGMAWGIDGIVHQSALEAGLPTIGILGTSLQRPYPPGNAKLFARMGREALLLTELYPEAAMGKWRFPERNRLLAALAEGIVVVEAPEKSGALLTAQEGLELGREIFVLPGPLSPHQNAGGHRLIQDGAHLLTHPRELFEILGYGPRVAPEPAPAGGQSGDPLLEILRQGPLHVDKIISISQKPAPEVTARLIELCMEGSLAESGSGIFELI